MLAMATLPNYCCVRWEGLLSDPHEALAAVADWLGLDVDAAAVATAAATLPPPAQLRLHGRAAAIVDVVGGQLLASYGYAPRSLPRAERLSAWAELARAGAGGAAERIAGRWRRS